MHGEQLQQQAQPDQQPLNFPQGIYGFLTDEGLCMKK